MAGSKYQKRIKMAKKTDHKRLWRKEQVENERLRNHIRVLAQNAQAANEIVLLLLNGKLTIEQLKKELEGKLPLDNITKTVHTEKEQGQNDNTPTEPTS